MEEFTYYTTIVSIILILVSYSWFYRNDRLTRRLVAKEIEHNKLVVLLATPDEHEADQRLKEALEKECFIVHEIRRAKGGEPEPGSSQDDNNSIKVLGPNLNNQPLEANEYLDEKLAAQGQRLHAVISLAPKSSDCDDGCSRQSSAAEVAAKSLERDCLAAPSSATLLSRHSSLSHAITRSGARVIRVVDMRRSVCQKAASLFKLYEPLEGTISESQLPSQGPARRWLAAGQRLIDIKLIGGARMSYGTMGSFIKSLASNLNNGGHHIAGNEMTEPSEHNDNNNNELAASSGDDEPGKSDSCSRAVVASKNIVEGDARIIKAIVESVVHSGDLHADLENGVSKCPYQKYHQLT